MMPGQNRPEHLVNELQHVRKLPESVHDKVHGRACILTQFRDLGRAMNDWQTDGSHAGHMEQEHPGFHFYKPASSITCDRPAV
jgi:hypothetical protein